MGLAKLPLRIATVMALATDQRLPWRVFDSSISPIADTVTGASGSVILVVYTDGAHEPAGARRDFLTGRPVVELKIHAAVAAAMEVTAAGVVVTLAQSDAAFEAQLDLVEAAILRRLQRGSDPWCDLWRAFAQRHGDVHSRRGASSRRGLKFAARELIIEVETVPDPLGTGDEYPWNDAIALFEATDDVANVAPFLASFCTDQQSMPEWRLTYGALGMDAATARSFSFATSDGEDVTFP